MKSKFVFLLCMTRPGEPTNHQPNTTTPPRPSAMELSKWRDEDWVGKGLKYMDLKDNPVVQQRRKALFQIPEEFVDVLPHPNLSLQGLLKKMRGITTSGAVGRFAEQCFSSEQPNTSLGKAVEIRVIPPKHILDEMEKIFGQLWFDGKANSVIDWTHRLTRYPLSAFTVYWELNRACTVRSEWTRASQWMNLKVSADLLPVVREAGDLMFAYEWDQDPRVRDVRMPTKELLSVLGNNWMSDEHVDSLMRALTLWYEAEFGQGDVVFAPCILQHWLRQRHGGLKPAGLKKYDDLLRTGAKRVIYLIAHINNNHWVAWKVDFASGTFGHG